MLRTLQAQITSIGTVALLLVTVACAGEGRDDIAESETEGEARAVGAWGASQSAAPLSEYRDEEGRRWVQVGKVEHFDDSPPVAPSGKEPDPDIHSMTVEELTDHFRPKSEFAGYEYRMADDDAREFALALRDAAKEINEVGTAGEPPLGASVSDVAGAPEQRNPHAVIGGDNRSLINSSAATYPYNNTGREIDWCSVFKMVNHYTAVTAAHCVHSGSAWKTRKELVFQSPLSPLPNVPSQCYGRVVPGCWDGDSASCDYAVFYLRGRNGAWCPDNTHNVGYLGYNTVSSCTTGIKAYLSGYPLPPPFGWSYPALVYHYREDGWTSCGTYPDRVWYYNDATGGQSGAPLVSYWSDGSWRVRAIHKGFFSGVFDDSNQGRRMTSDLYSWLSSNSGF
jgi:V8-like Glu-specific endopeptidase